MKIYQNQPVRITFCPGVGTSTITEAVLNYKDPLGDFYIFEPIETLDADNLYYDAVTGDFSEIGVYILWATITTAEGDFPTDPFTIEVLEEASLPIVTRSFVKSYLGITDNSTDVIIDALIKATTAEYLDIRNAPWDEDENGNYIYPDGSDCTISEMVGYRLSTRKNSGKNVTSESIDSYSVSFDSRTFGGYPSTITGMIKKFARGD